MQKDQSDQELNFKKRARRRLVGAIALVVLMVVILPIVLKDRAVTSPQEKITITLPNEGEPMSAPTQVPSDFDSSVVPDEHEQPEVAAAAEVDVESPKPDATEKSETVAVPEPPQDSTHAKSATAHKFYVQIGVFSDAARVKKLQSKLTDLGYKTQTEKINTPKGEKIRLKTQTFAERNDAALALEKIKGADLPGMVVSQ